MILKHGSFAQGVLKVNACGLLIWTVLSSIVFEILHKRGLGTKLTSALSKQSFTLVGFAYVDDCNLIQARKNPLQVMESMQRLINRWGSLMKVTGGTLRTNKS